MSLAVDSALMLVDMRRTTGPETHLSKFKPPSVQVKPIKQSLKQQGGKHVRFNHHQEVLYGVKVLCCLLLYKLTKGKIFSCKKYT